MQDYALHTGIFALYRGKIPYCWVKFTICSEIVPMCREISTIQGSFKAVTPMNTPLCPRNSSYRAYIQAFVSISGNNYCTQCIDVLK